MLDVHTETVREIHLTIKKLQREKSQAKSDLEKREFEGMIKGLKLSVSIFITRNSLINLRGNVS